MRSNLSILRNRLGKYTGNIQSRYLSSATSHEPKVENYSYKRSLGSIPETKVTTLPNGLRVATESQQGFGTSGASDYSSATVGLWIGAGSRFENLENNGVAHFLEHMLFKGTNQRSRQEIEIQIEQMGAQLNAYTSREQTAYFARCLSKDIPATMSILSDLVQNSLLNPADIEAERSTILREKQEVEKVTEEVVFDHLHACAYQGSSLGYTILGSDENISKSINKEQLMEYVRQHYTSDRMVLVGAGGVDHEQLCKLGEQLFGKLPKSSSANDSGIISPPPTDFIGSEIKIRDDTQRQSHIAVAVEGVGWDHPDHIPLLVAQTIAGSWDRSLGNGSHLGSKLAQAISEKNIADSFTSFNTTYSDTSLFGLYLISSSRTGLIDLCETSLFHWTSIAHSATPADLYRAKNQLKSSLLFSLDSSVQVADEIGRHMLTFGRRLSPLEMDQMINDVTLDKVKDVASKYLYDRDPAVVATGPIEAWPDYVIVRSNMNQILR